MCVCVEYVNMQRISLGEHAGVAPEAHMNFLNGMQCYNVLREYILEWERDVRLAEAGISIEVRQYFWCFPGVWRIRQARLEKWHNMCDV